MTPAQIDRTEAHWAVVSSFTAAAAAASVAAKAARQGTAAKAGSRRARLRSALASLLGQ